MTYKVCIDIGGTFTDGVVSDNSGSVQLHKSPSTPPHFEKGFLNVLKNAADSVDLDFTSFLRQVELIVHGTTVSTNALVMNRHARTGLIVNRGFPDILLLREGPRKRSFEWRLRYPEAFVPRSHTCEVTGRIDARGNEIELLSLEDVSAAAETFRALGVEAVAVSFLWSVVNPAHERMVRERLAEELSGVPVVLSHELNPIPREYRRTIATAIDASLHPIMDDYVGTLSERLCEAGYKGELLVANCLGGMMPPEDIVEKPIYSVMSGPTLAPIAAQEICDSSDIIVVDMGGTTFDVSAVRGHNLVVTAEAMVGQDLLGIPKVDVRSVGAGGGSIAWVDSGGLLRVGPSSAGASPGPACYGNGGSEPTVTDANVVLGIIDPEYFLGGKMPLDKKAAEHTVAGVAEQLGIGTLEAAYAIHTTSNHNMVGAIENITINEGLDPRESFLVSGGGAMGCHIAEMAEILGVNSFMVPKVASALSAFGGLISDIRFQSKATYGTNSLSFDAEGVTKLLNSLKQEGVEKLRKAGIPEELWAFECVVSGHYEFQSWDIEVPFEFPARGLDQDAVRDLVRTFHEMYERIYAIKDEGELVEFLTWSVSSIGKRRSSGIGTGQLRVTYDVGGMVQPDQRRDVYLHASGGVCSLPVLKGEGLSPGSSVEGPCLIEEETTTILINEGMSGRVDEAGNYIFHVAAKG